jgi:hypothetical protein
MLSHSSERGPKGLSTAQEITVATTSTGSSTAKRRRLATAGTLLAIAAAMTALAPTANAQTEQQIKAGCKEAGGTYTTRVGSIGNFSTCCYKDYYGDRYCDIYIGGTYIETDPEKAGQPPVSLPAKPPPVAPPITNGPPAANAN